MSHWNHRVMRAEDETGEVGYTIREVFYDDAGRIDGWTAEAIAPYSETLEGLAEEVEGMLECCELPVLDEDTLLDRDGGAFKE